MRLFLPIAATVFVFGGTVAMAAGYSPLDDPPLPGATRYDRCLALAQEKPQRAYDSALAWRNAGGSTAAAHCLAVAMVGLGHYAEAGLTLDALARNPAIDGAAHRAAIFAQAGNAWLLAHNPGAAELSLSEALKLVPGDADVLADRARAKAMRKDWTGADADLTSALTGSRGRPDLLVLRASARRAEGHVQDARADLEAALRLRPGYDEALLERGTMKLQAGDKAGARADWQEVLAGTPDGPAAQSARKRLEQIK